MPQRPDDDRSGSRFPKRFALAVVVAGGVLALAAWLPPSRTSSSSNRDAPADRATEVAQGAGPVIVPRPVAPPGAGPARDPRAAGPVVASDREPVEDDAWSVVHVGTARVGYGRSTTRRLLRDGVTLFRTVQETHLKFKRLGQDFEMHVELSTDEEPDGALRSFAFDVRNPPAASTRTVGRVESTPDGLRLALETTVAGRTDRRSEPWTSGVKSSVYQDRQLREQPLKASESRTFDAFPPELGRVSKTRLAADDWQLVKLLDGRQHKLLKVRITQSALPSLTTRAWLDEAGRTLLTETDFAGMLLATYRVPESIALEAIAGAELDIVANTLIPVQPPLRLGHRARRATYRLSLPIETARRAFVESEWQKVRAGEEAGSELVVTAPTIPDRCRTVAAPEQFLSPSRYLQSRDPRIVEHARRASAGETDPGRIALAMEKYVREKVEKKNFSTALASAAEVAETLEGDCTEHAVLLAAMLRAARIPSRVAIGLVYVEGINSFGGHMWTEAWLDGRWIPLDGILGRGGIGAAHLKMGDASFADDGPAPQAIFLPLLQGLANLKIEVVSAE